MITKGVRVGARRGDCGAARAEVLVAGAGGGGRDGSDIGCSHQLSTSGEAVPRF